MIPPHRPHGFIPPHGPFGPHGFIPPHGPFGPHGFIPPHGPFGPHGFIPPHGPFGPQGYGGPHGFGGPHGLHHPEEKEESIKEERRSSSVPKTKSTFESRTYQAKTESTKTLENRQSPDRRTYQGFGPHGPMGPHHGFGGPHGYGGPHGFMPPHGPMGPHGFMPPHGPHGFMPPHGPFGPHHGFEPHGPMGPHYGYEPHGFGGPHGFMPLHGPFGPHHGFEPHGFGGPHGPHRFGGSFREVRALTEEKERGEGNITGMSQYRFQQTTSKSERGDRGDNYEYFESKHVLKSGRVNQQITIHRRRGGEDGRYSTPQIKGSDNRSSSYNKISSQRESRNQTGTGIVGTKYTQKTTYRNKIINQNSNIKGKEEGKSSNTFTEYKKYTQKGALGKMEGTGSANTSKYGMNQSVTQTKKQDYKQTGSANTSKYGMNQSVTQTKKQEYKQIGAANTSRYGTNQSMTQTKKQEYKRVEYGLNGEKDAHYESFDESEFQVVFCPVHGRQLVRKKKFMKLD